ncbi:MAG: NUDIX domain-containing protein [Armatimonadota bacterium]
MQISDRVPVVTAFVCRDGKVALIKRSRKVRSYKGMWAAFSGYVEQIPLLQARLELLDEAGLSEWQARLVGIGVPVPVDDGRERWLIFPFLFEATDGIRADWEAEEWGWFDPSDLARLETVPGLAEALHRVWPPFGDNRLWRSLGGVAADTEHGATELARRGLRAVGRFAQEHRGDLDYEGLHRLIAAFAAARPSMGIFPDLAARLLLAVERESGIFDFDELLTELLGAVEDATRLSAQTASEALRDALRIFTLSYSETVRDAILSWYTADTEVVIAESAPKMEGRQLAAHLADHGVRVRLVTDSEALVLARDVDAVLVGCDAITSVDEVQNKVGTRDAVLAARDAGVPCYAVTQTAKIVPPGWPVFLELQEGKPIFDLTPLSEFAAVFTEEGILTPVRLAEIRAELGSVPL